VVFTRRIIAVRITIRRPSLKKRARSPLKVGPLQIQRPLGPLNLWAQKVAREIVVDNVTPAVLLCSEFIPPGHGLFIKRGGDLVRRVLNLIKGGHIWRYLVQKR
jgi:hypothetical protein